jgi:DNA-binding Xre family transcriptional regulator
MGNTVQLRVREIAEVRNLSRASLMRSSGLSDWTMRQVWKKPGYNIGLQTLAKIAWALDVSICELIEESQEERADQGARKHR